MNIKKIFNSQLGQSLVELLLAIGLSALLLPIIFVGIMGTREGKAQQNKKLEATNLLTETQEAVRNVRESGWTNLATFSAVIQPVHPTLNGSMWTLLPGSETIGEITRYVTITDVYRNTMQGQIVDASFPGAILDPSTKKIDTTISWNSPIISSITSTMYLTRFLENNSYTETTQDDFNFVGRSILGLQTNVTVKTTNPPLVANDGEVILGAGGNGDWCSPHLLSNVVDVPGQSTQKAITAIPGHAYVGTGGNASGDSLDHYTITSPLPPTLPTASLAGSYNNYKSYGIFGNSNYAYLTSDHPGLTLDIVQITSTPYNEIGTANAGSAGVSVYVLDNIGYVTTANNRLYTFNLQNLNGSHSPIANVALAGEGIKVVVVGNYAFVANNTTNKQLQIVEVSNNGTTLNIVRSISVPGQAAKDLYVNSTGTRAYLATAVSSTQRELFIIDVDTTSPTYGQIRGSYDTNGMDINGITVVPGNNAIIGGIGAETYQVVDIHEEDEPEKCGGLTLSNGWGIYGLASILDANNNAFTYILTNDSSGEFKMIEGGPGGAFATNGTFESATLDAGYTTANNRFTADFSQPPGTTIHFQVSMTNLVGGVCPSTGSYTFVGLDGLTTTESTLVSGQSYTFPFVSVGNYTNPGQCIRYKAYFSTSNANTPVLNDITINYSP